MEYIRTFMKRIVFISFVIMVFSANVLFAKTYDIYQISQAKLITEYSEDTTVDQMDTVTFGCWSNKSGNTKEPIEWIILDKEGDKALLLSKFILLYHEYMTTEFDTNWGGCPLRTWLNYHFIRNAFSKKEENSILTTYVINNDNVQYGTKGGGNSEDKIFLLSIDEFNKYFNEGKQAVARYSNRDPGEYMCWVLRSPGKKQNYVAEVRADGTLSEFGAPADVSENIRPALWVDISGFRDSNNGINKNSHFEETSNNNTKNAIVSGGEKGDDVARVKVGDKVKYYVKFYGYGESVFEEVMREDSQPYRSLHGRKLGDVVDGDYFFNGGGNDYSNKWVGWSLLPVYSGTTAYFRVLGINGVYLDEGNASDSSKLTKITGLPSRESELKNDNHFYLDNNLQKNSWVYYVKDYYHVDGSGNIEKSKWIEERYVGSDGKMYRGRQTPDGQWVGYDGLVVNVTQDLQKSILVETAEPDSWYRTQSGLWYYFENDRTTTKKGWFNDKKDDQWYYLEPSTGIMQVGWVNIDGKDYYFNESHDNEPNWYEVEDGFYESYGKKVKAYGSMFKNEETPDGYWVNNDGEYIKKDNFLTAMNPKVILAIIAVIILLINGKSILKNRY